MLKAIVSHRVRATLGAAVLAVTIAAGALVASASQDPSSESSGSEAAAGGDGLRRALAVSNNWEGTVDLVDPRRFELLKRLNVIPDYVDELAERATTPGGPVFYAAIREGVGEGHDQFVDDAFTSPNGRRIYISRPSFADVVAIKLRNGEIAWEVPMEGFRSDHMAISENGRHVVVSDSTANVAHVINTRKGEIVDQFPSGDSPHENNFSENGERLFHASIGRVYTPTDQPEMDTSKGEHVFHIVDTDDYEVLKTYDMGVELEQAGYPDMSSAVRPMTLSPSERFVYFQVSFFHGFVEFDFKRERVTRVINLPIAEHAQDTPREEYLLDSAHHGLSMNPRGTRLCAAGTMSDYAAIVSRQSGRYKIVQFRQGAKPYWSTNSANGRYCFVSISGYDRVAVISYRTGKRVNSFRVGVPGEATRPECNAQPTGENCPAHPQRMRLGVIRQGFLD